MSRYEISVDPQPYDVLDGSDLTAVEREAFDYLDWHAIDEGTDSASFVRRQDGTVYDLGSMERVPPESVDLAGWHGVTVDSFFSGVLLRYADAECDTVELAGYYVRGD